MLLRLKTGILLIFTILAGCRTRHTPAPPGMPAELTSRLTPTGLTQEQVTTLNSLHKVDDYPLYTMTYAEAYRPRADILPLENPATAINPAPTWACSLFTVLLDEEHLLYGRSFDWQFSPALPLFTNPSYGYASVSMVAITYLGFDSAKTGEVTDLPIEQRSVLLDAPYLPFDGMNEHGLAIGMAAVPPGYMQPDANKATVGSLGIIRKMLDHARNVDEAVGIIKSHNIDSDGGPPIHYLLADVAQNNTQWSVVYQMSSGTINIAMGQNYQELHQFQLNLVNP